MTIQTTVAFVVIGAQREGITAEQSSVGVLRNLIGNALVTGLLKGEPIQELRTILTKMGVVFHDAKK